MVGLDGISLPCLLLITFRKLTSTTLILYLIKTSIVRANIILIPVAIVSVEDLKLIM
jgi:hypothetical protein